MGLFNESSKAEIEAIAAKSKKANPITEKSNRKINSIVAELDAMSDVVMSYFKDSPAILITDKDMLIDYVDKLLVEDIAGIDTETTGLDRINDYVVGASLYYPGGVECYIPMKHKVPIFDTWYPNQLSYEDVATQLKRIVDKKHKLIFANADFDLSMIYKDFSVDLCPAFYYDVILAWRCIQEDEKDNTLKGLYNKYVLGGKGDPKKFSDFFTPEQFPYCNPNVAKLYAANDAKITVDLFEFQRQYVDKSLGSDKYLDRISDLIYQIEFPLVEICQKLHRTGIYFDSAASKVLIDRYHRKLDEAQSKLVQMIDDIIKNSDVFHTKKTVPFTSGKDFNPKSILHMRFLIYDILKRPVGRDGSKSADKNVLSEMNTPITNQILEVRSISTLLSTFVDKLPNSVAPDGRIHPTFKQIGASCITGDSIVPTNCGWTTMKEVYDSIGDGVDGEHLDVDDLYIYNKDGEQELCQSVVRYKNVDTIKITTEHGFIIEGTHNHPILMKKSRGNCFVQLSDINIDDEVVIPRGFLEDEEYSKIQKIEYSNNTVYDFHVPGTHSFIANGMISHNTGRFSCIYGDAMISCEDGNKKLCDIRIGDKVISYNGGLQYCNVKNKWFTGHKKCIKIRYIMDGKEKSIVCTPEHPIRLYSGEWIHAKDLRHGDNIMAIGGDVVE